MDASPSQTCFTQTLADLVDRRELPAAQMRETINALLAGRWEESEAAAFLVALRMKGETAAELAAAAEVLRDRMIPLDTGRADVLDTCGTGGDHSGTFNVSTAAALVAAAAGVPVVKHGNRAMSSHSGSADVLAALGVVIEGDAAWARQCLDCAGIAFCFAQHFHPALKNLAAVRRRLKIRTLFNCLGPLANPARAAYQLIGVSRQELLDPMAGALAHLGTRHAFLVHGEDGLDEVSLSGTTLVREVCGGIVVARTWQPFDFALAPCSVNELAADSPAQSADMIREILEGADGAPARVVLANAAAALLAAECVRTPREGVALAEQAIKSGRARQVLDQLRDCSHG